MTVTRCGAVQYRETLTCTYHGPDPLAYVNKFNLHRRHLKENQS